MDHLAGLSGLPPESRLRRYQDLCPPGGARGSGSGRQRVGGGAAGADDVAVLLRDARDARPEALGL